MSTTITAANNFTEWSYMDKGEYFSVSVSGTFVAIATIQRSKDKVTILDVQTTSAPAEYDGEAGSGWWYRVGVKTGEFTSGSVVVDIS